jgi:hypothetical protein
MKTLSFIYRGEKYLVNEKGEIKANGLNNFSSTWIFLGGSKYWNSRGIDFNLSDIFQNPNLLNGCYGWDKDHGTTRQWGGLYNGKIPKINSCQIATFYLIITL